MKSIRVVWLLRGDVLAAFALVLMFSMGVVTLGGAAWYARRRLASR